MSAQTNNQIERILIVGKGCYVKALSFVLNAASVSFPIKTGICGELYAVILVLTENDFGPATVRLHRGVWRTLRVDRARWLILAENKQNADQIRQQDVYGRINGNDTFGNWNDRYAIMSRSDNLALILQTVERLKPMWRSTWQDNDNGMGTILEMQRRIEDAIRSKDCLGRDNFLRDLPLLNWECFCDHDHANQIREWLARDKICRAWMDEGMKLLSCL